MGFSGNGIYDFDEGKEFSHFGPNRIIFPVFSITDNIVHFSSRSIDDSEPKHMHLSKPIKFLYNERILADKPKRVFVVEGIFDCLSMISNGFINTVATFGAGGFKDSFTTCFDKTTEINIIFDNDSNDAGIKGAVKTAFKFVSNDINKVFIVQLPKMQDEKKSDCNSVFANNGYETMLKSIAKRKSIYDFSEFHNLVSVEKTKEEVKKQTRKKPNYQNYDILELVKEHAKILRYSSSRAYAVCPFHGDTQASLIIYKNTNSWFCFGCQIGGSPYTFIKELEKMGVKQNGHS